jgi:hypothetical protein
MSMAKSFKKMRRRADGSLHTGAAGSCHILMIFGSGTIPIFAREVSHAEMDVQRLRRGSHSHSNDVQLTGRVSFLASRQNPL